MVFKTCEEYVLEKLESTKDELFLANKVIEELKSELNEKEADYITLEKSYEESVRFQAKILEYLLTDNYSDRRKGTKFEDEDFPILFKEKLSKIGITKEIQEEYVRNRLKESEKEN